jgi:hypothetical protein
LYNDVVCPSFITAPAPGYPGGMQRCGRMPSAPYMCKGAG